MVFGAATCGKGNRCEASFRSSAGGCIPSLRWSLEEVDSEDNSQSRRLIWCLTGSITARCARHVPDAVPFSMLPGRVEEIISPPSRNLIEASDDVGRDAVPWGGVWFPGRLVGRRSKRFAQPVLASMACPRDPGNRLDVACCGNTRFARMDCSCPGPRSARPATQDRAHGSPRRPHHQKVATSTWIGPPLEEISTRPT